jgi:hypothetical protein
MVVRIVSKGADLLRHNRLLSTIYHELRLRYSSLGRGSPILVYQMGKVGSSSIFDSIKSAGVYRPLFHIHFLNLSSIQNAEERLRKHFGNRGSVNRWALYESRFVLRRFLQRPVKNLKLVSLVREPVARNISSFFSNLDLFIPDFIGRFTRGDIGIPDITRHYLQDFHEHTYPLTWFDNEVKDVFGIDVFSNENLIQQSRGLFSYKRGNVDLLVLRVDDIDEVAVPALQDFLGIELNSLVVANEAEGQEYDRAYREFKKELKLPEQYLSAMYQSKLVTRFYSDTEIDRFRRNWSRR